MNVRRSACRGWRLWLGTAALYLGLAAVGPAVGWAAFRLPLPIGWTLLSLPEEPADATVATVLAPVAGRYDAVWTWRDGRWLGYSPAAPDLSDLAELHAGVGYWIHMTAAGELTGTGSPVPGMIRLQAGWNLVGLPTGAATTAVGAVAQITGGAEALLGFDAASGWAAYEPGGTAATLDVLASPAGYWVEMATAGTWAPVTARIDPATGGTLDLADGARLELAPGFGPEPVPFSLVRLSETGRADILPVVGGRRVSAVYRLEFPTAAVLDQPLLLSLPLRPELLPPDLTPTELQARLRAGAAASAADTVALSVPVLSQVLAADGQLHFELGVRPSTAPDERGLVSGIVLVGLTGILVYVWTPEGLAALTGQTTFMPFTVHYAPVLPPCPHSVRADTVWPAHDTFGPVLAPTKPNFVTDLAGAAWRALDGLAGSYQDSAGAAVFTRPSATEVYVRSSGGEEDGDSGLGADVMVNGPRLDSVGRLRETIAHELVHHLQGQKYFRYDALDRWFIEATATYLSTRVCGYSATAPMQYQGLTDEERRDVYVKEANHYLSASITSNDGDSYYALGHFLEWLDTTWPGLVGDVLNTRNANALEIGDVAHLRETLKRRLPELQGVDDNRVLGTVLARYVADVFTHPDRAAGIGRAIQGKLSTFLITADGRVPYLNRWTGASLFGYETYGSGGTSGVASTDFSSRNLYARLRLTQAPLSVVFVDCGVAGSAVDGLLVMTTAEGIASGPMSVLRSSTYAFSTPTPQDADFVGLAPLDQGLAFPPPRPLVVRDFGAGRTGQVRRVQRTVVNISSNLPDEPSWASDVYVLPRLPVTSVRAGTGGGVIGWDRTGICTYPGGLPPSVLDGFDIYCRGVQANPARIPPPAPAGGTQLPEMTFESAAIDPNLPPSDYTVVAVDKLGNRWPETVWDGVIAFEAQNLGQRISVTVSGLGGVSAPRIDPEDPQRVMYDCPPVAQGQTIQITAQITPQNTQPGRWYEFRVWVCDVNYQPVHGAEVVSVRWPAGQPRPAVLDGPISVTLTGVWDPEPYAQMHQITTVGVSYVVSGMGFIERTQRWHLQPASW